MTTGRGARCLGLAAVVSVCLHAGSFSRCDVDHTGTTSVVDVQAIINEGLGAAPAKDDLNSDAMVTVADVQIGMNAVLHMGCAADPHLLSIVPNTGQQGVSGITVTISGALTSFSNSSVVDLGAGITVSDLTAVSATLLTATLSTDGNAGNTARTLTVEGLTLAGAFTVTLPVTVSYAYDSQGRLASAT